MIKPDKAKTPRQILPISKKDVTGGDHSYLNRLYVNIGTNEYNEQKKDVTDLLLTIKSVPFVSKRGNMLAHGIKKQKNTIDG